MNKPQLENLRRDRWPRNRHEALVYFAPEKGERVLDIGCGNGLVLYNLKDNFENLTGIEMSENRSDQAKANLADISNHVDILNDNIEDGVDKSDGWFDVIMWSDVIEHVVDVFKAMEHISRLLKPDGTLITITPNVAYLKHRIRLLFGKFPATSADEKSKSLPGIAHEGGHVHYFTINTLKTIYKRAGIKPVRTIGYGRFGRLQNSFPSLLSGGAMLIGKKSRLK